MKTTFSLSWTCANNELKLPTHLTILYYTILYYTILYYTILYYTILTKTRQFLMQLITSKRLQSSRTCRRSAAIFLIAVL